jgi:hypothetical protein
MKNAGCASGRIIPLIREPAGGYKTITMRGRRRGRSRARAILLPVATSIIGAISSGCHHETGPSLSIVVESRSLAPTLTEPNASSQCCCRVRGTVRNTSTIAVHVNVNFEARDADGRSLGTALDWIPNLAPDGRASFDAVGILGPCSVVKTLTDRHLLTGVYTGAGS